MRGPPHPPDETRRLSSLHATGVLDTPPEHTFDAIVELARHVADTPIALVSLVDHQRQWFKAKVGYAVEAAPRQLAFCAHAILGDEPLVVSDALADPRFADNPLVTGEPHLRFYAGVPLVLEDGSAVGTLCVLDHVPRQPQPHQLAALSLLARQVASELSLRRRIHNAALLELEANQPPSEPATPVGGMPMLLDAIAESGKALRDTMPIRPVQQRGDIARGLLAGRYRIEQSLGGGGRGVVVGATGPGGERVALKFLRDAASLDPDLVERFAREAQVLMRITSPNVARILDVGSFANGKPFIVMEWLDGEDLAERLAYQGALPPEEALALARQLCLGAAAAHEAGVVHRDIKPANIFLVRVAGGDLVKLLDFGVSGLVTPDPRANRVTIARTALGTPAYMAPEQVYDPRASDVRSDVWAIGLVLYQMLTGTLPPGGDEAERERALTTTLVTERRLSPALADVVWGCLRWERGERFASARAVAGAIDQL